MPKVVGFDEKIKKRVTCKHCSAINEYLPIEVKTNTYRDYGGGSDSYDEIKCANDDCGKQIRVKS